MKTQLQYSDHNSDSIHDGWVAIDEYIQDAVLVAFDGCHKIYLAMDETEAAFFREHYQPAVVESDPAEMLDHLSDWWDGSCALRFISAVWHNENDPNAGFVSLISQCATLFGEDEEEDEDDEGEE